MNDRVNLKLTKARRFLIASRWIDLLCLSLLASFILVTLYSYLSNYLNHFLIISNIQPTSVLLGSYLFALITTYLLNTLGCIHPEHTLGTLYRYPATWISLGITLLILTILLKYFFTFDFLYFLCSIRFLLLCISFGCLSSLFYIKLEEWSKSTRDSLFANPTVDMDTAENLSELEKWLLEEKAIDSDTYDFLDYSIIAKRIVKLLLNPNHVYNIGLIGAYGSGKSSLISLVKKEISPKKSQGHEMNEALNILFCSIDGWGLNERSVAQSILKKIINEAQKVVDCLSIKALPEHYRNAITSSRSTWGNTLLSLFSSYADPLQDIKKLDDILFASHTKIILFLEDLDRNGNDFIIRDEVPALLDHIKNLRSIRFVLAIGSERSYSDFIIKTCSHTERL